MDLALNNQQMLICYKTKQTNQPNINKIAPVVVLDSSSDESS